MKANALADTRHLERFASLQAYYSLVGRDLEQRGVSSVIIGAKKMDQLEDNLGAVDGSFTEDELERLDELTKPTPQYPQWMIQFQNRREDR